MSSAKHHCMDFGEQMTNSLTAGVSRNAVAINSDYDGRNFITRAATWNSIHFKSRNLKFEIPVKRQIFPLFAVIPVFNSEVDGTFVRFCVTCKSTVIKYALFWNLL